MNIETLEDLFGYQLQHAYYAERTQLELLADLADDAATDELGERFTTHIQETERHVERLEDVFDALGRRPQASRSRTADGLADARRLQRDATVPGGGDADATTPAALETAMLAERLEIRTYEMLVRLAGRLAYADDVVAPLEGNLADEREMLQRLEEFETEQSIVASMEPEEA